jgi:signal transduction histidine kinase
MTLAIALYFFLISAVMLGLMAVSLPFYKATNTARPSSLWAVTLGLNGLGTFLFAFSITLITEVENPPLLNTVANSFILGANFCLALFFRTLCRPTDQAASYRILWGFMAAFGIGYEVFKLQFNVQERIAGVGFLAAIFLLWQCVELLRNAKLRSSYHLALLLTASAIELVLVLVRVGLILLPESRFETIAEIPLLIVAVAWTQFAMQVISYTVLNGYWAELISRENARIDKENVVIRELSRKQEALITALARLNKSAASGALSASVAHELNQPLQAIQLDAEIARKQLRMLDDPRCHALEALLDNILRENRRATGVITALRGIFLNDGPEPRHADLADIVQSLEVLFHPLARSRGVHLVFQYDGVAVALIRPDEIRQVIVNVMNNAFDALEGASQASPEIFVWVGLRNGSVVCEVSDNGSGIDPEQIPDLFELLKGEKSKHMGFGLWLCRHVTERNRGRITVSPRGGGGTVVSLTFDAA